ncbi:choice-of-anchor I domain-containing protein [Bacillus arachidis]|uniref:choice-of-anchor I domain-containing protein n=1 Tax=Bacillus arachidis TaxID=2819290 RepID=UPI00255CFD8D|nr:YncE family protein [Bacillus arachidis]WIY61943.1 YncE family protein [Bacillus arachidis]
MKKKVLVYGVIIASVLWTGSNVHAETLEKDTEWIVNTIETLPKGSISNPAYRGKVEQMVTDFIGKKHKDTKINRIASFQMPSKKAEITASTPDGNTLVVTEADLGQIQILSIADLENIKVLGNVSFKDIHSEAEVTSVTVTPDGKYALAAFRTGDNLYDANKGQVAVVDLAAQRVVKTYEVGVGPDSVALAADGRTLIICNEDEENDPNDDNEVNMKKTKRPGSISMITFPDGDVMRGEHVELPIHMSNIGNGAIYKHDPQPEYVAINPKGDKAAVTLQENNAVAIVNIAEKRIENIFGLGTTTHKADLKKDGTISFQDEITARLEPDGVTWDPSGEFLITANEGDLGKNEFKDGVKSGGRNISVWNQTGSLVYDSMNLIDEKVAAAGLYLDNRSENRGSEVENVTIGKIKGNPILAVAAERANAVLFFDMTIPMFPVYIGIAPSAGAAPEGIHKINGRDLFVSADEVDGVLSFYHIK